MRNLNKELAKCKHPNSRKTKALTKRAKKLVSRNEILMGQNLKRSVLATKVQWFCDHLSAEIIKYSPELTKDLIQRYLSRFNEELEQIAIKHSIGKRKNRQHANREDIIKMTIKRETEEYTTCGIEMPNIMDALQLQALKMWDGDLISLQHMKLVRISKKMLEPIMSKTNSNSNSSNKTK